MKYKDRRISPSIQVTLIYTSQCSRYERFGGRLPSPPRHFGLEPITMFSSPLFFSIIFFHWSGLFATILRAWTGPFVAISSLRMLCIRRCLFTSDLTSENCSATTTSLKWVSLSFGLCDQCFKIFKTLDNAWASATTNNSQHGRHILPIGHSVEHLKITNHFQSTHFTTYWYYHTYNESSFFSKYLI